jgi:UDP-N-acetylglucosamine 4,6-dehydratase
MTCRFGNFIGSSGSCFDVWDRQKEAGEKITVTDTSAERYFISIPQVVNFITRIHEIGSNGKIYIPKMDSLNIYHLAMQWTEHNAKNILITGLREGEKVNELLYSEHERKKLIEGDDFYEI